MGELHARKAKSLLGKAKGEVTKARREANSNKADGGKTISKAIGATQSKPLTCVQRDQDTSDGCSKGEIATNPADIDAVVKRAWQTVHRGMEGCLKIAVCFSLKPTTGSSTSKHRTK